MEEFTLEELGFIGQILQQVSFKTGQSRAVILSESIINKCNEKLKQKQIKEDTIKSE